MSSRQGALFVTLSSDTANWTRFCVPDRPEISAWKTIQQGGPGNKTPTTANAAIINRDAPRSLHKSPAWLPRITLNSAKPALIEKQSPELVAERQEGMNKHDGKCDKFSLDDKNHDDPWQVRGNIEVNEPGESACEGPFRNRASCRRIFFQECNPESDREGLRGLRSEPQ
jgi:hypothetical protein